MTSNKLMELSMTRQEKIEDLQDKVSKNYILYYADLCKECDKGEDIDVFADVLSPMEWNCCDKCGALYPIEELCWVDYLDPDFDGDLIDILGQESEEYGVLCYECVKELKNDAE